MNTSEARKKLGAVGKKLHKRMDDLPQMKVVSKAVDDIEAAVADMRLSLDKSRIEAERNAKRAAVEKAAEKDLRDLRNKLRSEGASEKQIEAAASARAKELGFEEKKSKKRVVK